MKVDVVIFDNGIINGNEPGLAPAFQMQGDVGQIGGQIAALLTMLGCTQFEDDIETGPFWVNPEKTRSVAFSVWSERPQPSGFAYRLQTDLRLRIAVEMLKLNRPES